MCVVVGHRGDIVQLTCQGCPCRGLLRGPVTRESLAGDRPQHAQSVVYGPKVALAVDAVAFNARDLGNLQPGPGGPQGQ